MSFSCLHSKKYDPDTLVRLKNDMITKGVLFPITVTEEGRIVDGLFRLRMAVQINQEEIGVRFATKERVEKLETHFINPYLLYK